MVTAVESISPTPPIAGSVRQLPVANNESASSSSIHRKISKSWISMSLKMPPDVPRYSVGGAPGSRLVMTSISGSPISPAAQVFGGGGPPGGGGGDPHLRGPPLPPRRKPRLQRCERRIVPALKTD